MLRTALLSLVLALPVAARAHESWVEPLRWQIAPGETLQADIRVGQNMKGAPMPFLPGSYGRFEVLTPDGARTVEGLIGDKPALSMTTGAAGLYQIVHVSKDYVLTYDDFARFSAFVAHKDLGDILARHAARGLGQEVSELYTRYDKSLVAVGEAGGKDQALGLTTELTLLANPYAAGVGVGLPVMLTWKTAPRADTQIEVFERGAEGTVRSFMVRTDAEGRAVVPVRLGAVYLLSAVKMLARAPEEPGDPAWHSYWASLTFRVPAQ